MPLNSIKTTQKIKLENLNIVLKDIKECEILGAATHTHKVVYFYPLSSGTLLGIQI